MSPLKIATIQRIPGPQGGPGRASFSPPTWRKRRRKPKSAPARLSSALHLFIAPLANSGDAMNPLFVFKLFFCHSFGYIEKLLGNDAFELREGFALEDIGDLF